MATSFREVSEKERVDSAEFICAVEIQNISAEKKANNIRTNVQAKIIDCAKGSIAADQIEVQWPGGTKGSARTLIPGLTPPQAGETAVLFLDYDAAQSVYSLKAWQVDKLQKAPSGELVFEPTNSLRSRQHRQESQVQTWTSFKERVRNIKN